ncbi:hypothetical protein VN97_g4316 [Penicillium thymicola]|uniref:Uncharacterized protein n=1 Tax=Penicillium thymicola TaxID=293382 RepID=A0AAI9TKQ2_PENTH|nr:hypothetical protein VN97_g4316 [Penicillium thymicola]
MEETLLSLNSYLEKTVELLKREDIRQQLENSLHNHEPGVLPSANAAALANQSIDLLHQVEQLLEPGHLVLADHFFGYVHAKCLLGAVNLDIADKLEANGPMTIEDLAKVCGAHVDRLQQVLRVLCCNGIFYYQESTGCFSNNHTSTLLLSSHWTQWREWVILYGTQFYDMARGIPDSLMEGVARWPAQINFDTNDNMFTYFQNQGWLPQLHRTLGAGAAAQAPGILADYPWEEVANETVIDIGGGGGALVALLLREHKQMIGGVYDLPAVIDHINPDFHSREGRFADLGPRVPKENLIAGDFFSYIPPSKVYTLKWCLHDWKDEEAVKILRKIRDAIIMSPGSRLVVLESILDYTHSSRLSRYADMNMMITANGLERTMADWHRLAKQAGWEIFSVHHLRNSWPCAIDMRPLVGDDGSHTFLA